MPLSSAQPGHGRWHRLCVPRGTAWGYANPAVTVASMGRVQQNKNTSRLRPNAAQIPSRSTAPRLARARESDADQNRRWLGPSGRVDAPRRDQVREREHWPERADANARTIAIAPDVGTKAVPNGPTKAGTRPAEGRGRRRLARTPTRSRSNRRSRRPSKPRPGDDGPTSFGSQQCRRSSTSCLRISPNGSRF